MKLTLAWLAANCPHQASMGPATADPVELEKQLKIAFARRNSVDFQVVSDAKSSMGIFFTHLRPGQSGGVIMSAKEAADDLLIYANAKKDKAAQYDPASAPNAVKGWAVKAITFQGEPAALVVATWVGP